MAEPEAKRRRTSPPEDVDRASSPLKQPPRRGITPRDPARPRSPLKQPPRRGSFASYASPTKASLSRYNPNLLPRPTTADAASPRRDGRGNIIARGRQAQALVLEDTKAGARTEEAVASDYGEQPADAHVQSALEVQNATPRRNARTRGGASLPPGDVDEEDEGLPTTPSASQDTERRGILHSSPSKRPPRQRDPVKPSPLKKRVLQELPNARNTLLRGVDREAGDPVKEKTKEPFNPEMEKKKQEMARLERELQELERDVARCVDEVGKLQQQDAALILPTSQLGNLFSFINKISGSEETEEHPPPVSRLLCSFLPFKAQPIPPSQTKAEQDRPVPSHRPLELDDPLPYLQMFTSFKFESHVTIPNIQEFDASSTDMHQQHTIEISGPQKLLVATVVAKIDTNNAEIIELQIPRLSTWAERELGAFMRTKAKTMDLSASTWGLQSYWDIAKKRAEYWHRCEKTFADLILVPGRTEDDTAVLTRLSKKETVPAVTRKDLRRHLGRDSLTLQDSHILLKFRWKIGFDWTGEAESEVSVEPALPRVWMEADPQNHLDKIPHTFDALLRKRGAFEATRILVELLFSSEE
ncbi:hypothetical protein BCR34DRAFT_617973 [Clohesyomyces aquaticus]|uniref:Uncharacterized protein n=1 Tax=Clohesyomyces aquaticus TaxID=1231657 RepID=A0A1Y1YYF5_9PLEO|nr:hypothetical protein BCR34DRAFT_617973 [Clohesyomyces aquaticus]